MKGIFLHTHERPSEPGKCLSFPFRGRTGPQGRVMARFTVGVGGAPQEGPTPRHSVVGCVTKLPRLRSAQPLGHITYPLGLNFLIHKMGMIMVTAEWAGVRIK